MALKIDLSNPNSFQTTKSNNLRNNQDDEFIYDEKPQEISHEFDQYLTILYGIPGIGKSTFCSGFPNHYFFQTEPGLKGLKLDGSIKKFSQIKSWVAFKKAVEYFEENKDQIKYSPKIIDTASKLASLCVEYTCQQLNISHLSDAGYAKAYHFLRDEFNSWVTRFSFLPGGTIFICHATTNIFTEDDGVDYEKFSPNLPNQCFETLNSICDFMFFARTRKIKNVEGKPITKHIMITKPNDDVYAKDRFGILPKFVPLRFEEFLPIFDTRMNKKLNEVGTNKTNKTNKLKLTF